MRLEAFQVTLPLVRQFETSSHRKGSIEHILIRLEDDGAVGWGEIASPSDPYYCSETVDTCRLVLRRHLAPALLASSWNASTDPRTAGAAWSKIRGHHFAKAGVDMACWDLYARARGESVASLLGGTKPAALGGVSLGIEPTIDDLLAQVADYVSDGYRRVKLKIAPGWDVDPVREVRAAYPDLLLQVDANGVYHETAEHLEPLVALDSYGLLLIEQPFAPGALAAHARIQERLSTPVCLDESVDDLGQLDTAIALRAGRILNIKVSRMGGLSHALDAYDMATSAGWQVWCGGMHEFGVGRAANVALSSLPGFILPADLTSSSKKYVRDVVIPPIVAEDGEVRVPYDRPGLGHDVDEAYVRELAGSATFTLQG